MLLVSLAEFIVGVKQEWSSFILPSKFTERTLATGKPLYAKQFLTPFLAKDAPELEPGQVLGSDPEAGPSPGRRLLRRFSQSIAAVG